MPSNPFIESFHGIRYQVTDVARAIEFYTRHLGFEVQHQHLPAFASVSLGGAPILRPVSLRSGKRVSSSGTRW